jgi:hypothetical protein
METPSDPLRDDPQQTSAGALPEGDKNTRDGEAGDDTGPKNFDSPNVSDVRRQTAAAAIVAAWLLIGFASAGLAFFPGGGVAVASLGIAVSAFGMSSGSRKVAIAALAAHFVLLAANLLRLY